MRHLLSRPLLTCLLAALVSVRAFAQIPTWSAVNTGLDSVFGNAGKGVLDPQVSGITGIAYGNNTFVIVAQSVGETVIRWATSPDGTTWTAHSKALPSNYLSGGQSGIHFLNGKFTFFAAHSNGGFAEQWVYTSTDGADFTGTKMGTGRTGYVEFDASPTVTAVAGSNGGLVTSSNLTAWTSTPVVAGGSGYDHNDMAYGAGHFITSINGFGGAFYTSTDGSSWTTIPVLATPGGGFIEFGNGFFLAQSNGNKFKSTDGVNFTKLTPTITNANWLGIGGDLRFAGGRYLVTSTDYVAGKNGFLSSSDGVTWTPICYLPTAPTVPAGQSRSYNPLNLVYGNGKYILAANDIAQTLFTKTVLPILIVGDASPAPTPPTIDTAPVSANAVLGGTATFSVSASGASLSYQWYLNGGAISGATSATYTISVVSPAHVGSYTVAVTNSAGTTTSAAATLTLVTASNAGRIINLSVRTGAGTGAQTLIVGVVLGGSGVSGTKEALVRAVGPTLSSYGVSGVLADPIMTLYQGSTALTSNDNWAGDAQVTSAMARVGAFPFASTSSKDAALYSASVQPGVYSVQITGANSGTGVALAEIYDATDSNSFTATTPRLVNVSARTQVGTGDEVLIAGFVIGGSTSRNVLIRAIGPTLGTFGVTGVLADPKLELYKDGVVIASNDNWGGTTALTTAFAATGAFSLDPAAKDAALLVTLPPGVYSAKVTGVGNTTGVALVEVYEAP